MLLRGARSRSDSCALAALRALDLREPHGPSRPRRPGQLQCAHAQRRPRASCPAATARHAERLSRQVCCPLTDHLLGTYVPTATWVKRMRKVPGPEGERWGIPVEPKGVPQAPIIAAGKATERDFTPTALLNAPEPA